MSPCDDLGYFQQRVRDLRGPVLEAGRAPVLHPRPPLAGPRLREPSQPEAQAHGGRHDRVQHPEVRECTRYHTLHTIDIASAVFWKWLLVVYITLFSTGTIMKR